MKKIITLCLITFLAANVSAQEKKVVNAYISYATFNVTGENTTPYIETYLTFDRSSLVYNKMSDGQFSATINVTILFKQGESIKNYGKYTLHSPIVADTSNINGFFLDAQRYLLPNGTYTMEVTIDDINNTNVKPFVVTDEILIDFPQKICFSSIIALESYTKSDSESQSVTNKNGYELIPMVIPYYPETLNKLSFYAEIYNSAKQLGSDDKYLLNTYITTFESNTKLNNFFFTKRMNTKDTEVLINTIDISGLPSGNYYLVLEARDRNNEVIGINRFFFQRSNPNYQIDSEILESINTEYVFSGKITQLDTMREYLRSLEAISTQVERDYTNNLVKTDDLHTMQQYFYTFWVSRDNLSPENAWIKYYEQVKRVDASFSTPNRRGCKSDRGVVFLKYGAPDRIVQNYNEPGAYPYEIWHYYTLANQRNKKFVFMTKDIATNDFYQIHSDAIGELSNNRWQDEIYSRSYRTLYDNSGNSNSMGDKAGDYYETPR